MTGDSKRDMTGEAVLLEEAIWKGGDRRGREAG